MALVFFYCNWSTFWAHSGLQDFVLMENCKLAMKYTTTFDFKALSISYRFHTKWMFKSGNFIL